MTDGRIRSGDRDLGSAFAITGRAVVTAKHVVRHIDAGSVDFQPSSGDRLRVSRIELDPDLDIALLFLDQEVGSHFVPARGRSGAAWKVTSRPLPNDPELTGTVTTIARHVVDSAGGQVELLQLIVDQHVGTYRGYSGSAVLSTGPTGGVIGVLVEQVPHRQQSRATRLPEASNVLYAVPIQRVMDRLARLSNPAPRGADQTHSLFTGLTSLGADYAVWIENFVTEYLGRTGEPVPFGGRHRQLQQLSAWLANQNGSPYALVTAEAGRGKSALLVRWAAQVSAAGVADVIFVPISIRFNTAQAGVALPALAARLAAYHDEPLSTAERSAEQWQAEITAYLRRPPKPHRPLVVIVDGLDEATDWRPGAHLFPALPPPGLRVLVSARFVSGDTDESGWRDRLNWSSLALATSVALPPLDPEGVSDVLEAMGNPLAGLVSRVDIVGELHRLSEGDPLLVRLYVDELRKNVDDPAALSPDELPSIEAGMQGYFKRWRREMERVWRSLGEDPVGRRRHLQDFLNVLACALGPLSRDDLVELNPEGPTGFDLDWLVEDVGRFVIGDGVRQGFIFSHPRFGMFFHEAMGSREKAKWIESFVDYGRRVLRDLRAGTTKPADVSPYAVNFHGAHLTAAQSPSSDLYALLDSVWLAAWHAVDGTDAGFLNDCDRAWHRAETEAATHPDTEQRTHAVRTLFTCALAHASVAARSNNVPARLLAEASREGLLTPAQALAICRRIPDDHRRAEAVATLARELPAEWLHEAVSIAGTPHDEASRLTALTGVAPFLSGQTLRTARTIVESFKLPQFRARGLAVLSPHCAEPDRSQMCADALRAIESVGDARLRGRTLSAVAEFLPPPLLDRAVHMATRIAHGLAAARALCTLARHFPDSERARIVEEAMRRLPLSVYNAWALLRGYFTLAEHRPELRTSTLEGLATLPNEQEATALIIGARGWLSAAPVELVEPALLHALHFESASGQARRLEEIAALTPPAVRLRALDNAHSLDNVRDRVWLTAHLLAVDGPAADPESVADTLRHASVLDDTEHPIVLTLLATCLAGPAKHELLREALRLAQTVGDVSERISAVSLATKHLQGSALVSAQQYMIALCRQLGSADDASAALTNLRRDLTPEAADNALDLCRQLEPPPARVLALNLLSDRLPEDWRTRCRQQVLVHTNQIADLDERLRLLLKLPPKAYGVGLDKALLATVACLSEAERFRWLLRVLPRFTTTEAYTDSVRWLVARFRNNGGVGLSALVDALSAEVPADIVPDLLAMIEVDGNHNLLFRLLRHLPAAHLEPALRLADALTSSRDSHSWENRNQLASAVVKVFSRLPEDSRERFLPLALEWTLHVGNGSFAQRILLGRYPDDVIESMLDCVLALNPPFDDHDIPYDLAELTTHGPEQLRHKRVDQVVGVAKSMNFTSYVWTMIRLTQMGPPELGSAITAELVRHISTEPSVDRAWALKIVLTNVPHEYLAELDQLVVDLALEVARQMSSDSRFEVIFRVLADQPHPPNERHTHELRALIDAVSEPRRRVELLLRLSRFLPPTDQEALVRDAIRISDSVEQRRLRDNLMVDIVENTARVPGSTELLMPAVTRIRTHTARERALAALAPVIHALAEQNHTAAFAQWNSAVRTLSANPRPVFVGELALMMSTIFPATVAGPDLSAAFVTAVETVAEWWN